MRRFLYLSTGFLSLCKLEPGRSYSVAIVGGGLSGLACAYHLQGTGASVTIFDPSANPTGRQMTENTASTVAAGLMHPFSPNGGMAWRGAEAMTISLDMIHFAERQAPRELYRRDMRIARPCLTSKHLSMLSKQAEEFPMHCELLGRELAEQRLADSFRPHWMAAAIYTSSVIVNTPLYLSSLWTALQRVTDNSHAQCKWESLVVRTPTELSDLTGSYDAVILACGAGIVDLWPKEISMPPLTLVRGQNLVKHTRRESESYASSPKRSHSSSFGILSGEYIVPSIDGKSIIFGATHEYSAEDMFALPSIEGARALLQDKLSCIDGPEVPCEYDEAVSGVRVNAKRTHDGKVPIYGHIDGNTWFLSG